LPGSLTARILPDVRGVAGGAALPRRTRTIPDMSEETMVKLAQAALEHHGIGDTIVAVGQFSPRGQSGAMFAGGMLGSGVGDAAGGLAGGIGLGAGLIGGRHANAAASGLPATLMLAVSDSTVYGMNSRTRRQEPDEILFAIPREGLTAKAHQRVNVRVLELFQDETGSRIELEGNRLPVTHSNDVIKLLTQ
jgi:hypothetical protein